MTARPSPVELADRLKSAARELGFDLVGVTTAEPLAGAVHLRSWLAAGMNSEMAFMADTADVRASPDRFLPGARSAVCVALSCHDAPEPPELEPRDKRVVVARYARRRDYHKGIKRRLVHLGRRLRALSPGSRWRVATDAEPLLERELASRAGLGWIGKNACLINRRLGSDLVLGELVTDAEIAIDARARDHCGRCRACLDACPTGALTAPRRLDARHCISYLTIEHQSNFTPEDAASVIAHLFGCDICQAVCPWNQHAPARCAAALRTRGALGELNLHDLRNLDEPSWERFAAGSPLRRLGFDRFRRNLAAVERNVQARENQGEAR